MRGMAKQTQRNPSGPQAPKPLPKPPTPFWLNIVSALVVILLVASAMSYWQGEQKKETLSLSELAALVEEGKVESLEVSGSTITARVLENESVVERTARKESGVSLIETLTNLGVPAEKLKAIPIEVKEEGGFRYWFLTLLPFLAPMILVLILVWFIAKQIRGAGMQAFTFGQTRARVIHPDDQAQRVTFADVAGMKEAKEELEEVVDFLRHPKKYIDIGAQIPKGVLLMGPPGTGKTLLARAVAGEAGVPFFSVSGSEFVEMFVGVGASRVRDLFQQAKKHAPAIVFIDEIDAVGRVRGTGVGGGNDEREQTLNQILVEMDGFEPNEKVIVMAATNRPDVLDPALLRPGRFDRRVTLDLPDKKEREEILKIHARKKPLHADVNLSVIAERTPGFSGAELYALMNEAAILAARENRKEITQYDLLRSIEKVLLGPERRSHLLSPKEKEITAYHEAGHALVASVLPHADPVQKISLVARGRAAGYVLRPPQEDKKMHSRLEFLDDMAVALGGYAAERLVFGDLTTGPSSDLQQVTAIARNMVARWGMSEAIGPLAVVQEPGITRAGGAPVPVEREISERTAAAIDAEVERLVREALARAEDVLKKHRDVLDALAKHLIEVETMERDEFEAFLKEHGVAVKKKEVIREEPQAIES
ncbi:MAG: ATP-dependent zinc metalloprotease FtsH [Candidatus Parcubacteria bacterium]|nr:MAG: ATP-dependent zinc metalloprotease FtsH [Candidatus Parcubacteria bacterium]